MSPKISVIITAHNYAGFVKQAIESVFSQTMDDYEIIAVNDGSTDTTAEVLGQYENHPKIKVLTLTNVGLAAASNAGVRASSGEYVIRLDADDYFDENILLIESRILDTRPEIGMVYPDYYRIDKHGEILECVRLLKVNSEVKLLDRNPLAAGAMFRRASYDAIGGYNEKLRYQEDYDFWIRFIDKFHVYNVNLPLLYYRQHAESMSRNQEARMEARRFVKKQFVEKKGGRDKKNILCVLPIVAYNRYRHKLALHEVASKPLMSYVLGEALSADLVSRLIVDTDDSDIADMAKKLGAEVPYLRPAGLSGQSTHIDEVARYCLDWLRQNENYRPDIIAVLSYNYPMIREKHITEALDTMLLYDVDTVLSVTEDLTFHWQPGEHGLKPVVYQKRLLREDKSRVYKETGGIIVSKVPPAGFNGLVGKQVSFIELEPHESFKIASDVELFLSEQIFKNSWVPSGRKK